MVSTFQLTRSTELLPDAPKNTNITKKGEYEKICRLELPYIVVRSERLER